MDDDLNTPIMFAHLFDGVKFINSVAAGTETISATDLAELKKIYHDLVFGIAGLKQEFSESLQSGQKIGDLMEILLNLRIEAKTRKDFATADKISDQLQQSGFVIKDKKDGFEWEIKD